MAAKRVRPRRVVEIPPAVIDQYEQLAADVDLATTSFVVAVLAGAAARGITHSLMMHAVDRKLVTTKRRPRPALPWESDGENWHYGGWTLVRRGDPKVGLAKREGDGWYLHGPGQPDDGMYLDVHDNMLAKDAANDIIRSAEVTAE